MTTKFKRWIVRLLTVGLGTTRDRCRDLRWCIRIDDRTCCRDRIRTEASLTRLRDERALWSG